MKDLKIGRVFGIEIDINWTLNLAFLFFYPFLFFYFHSSLSDSPFLLVATVSLVALFLLYFSVLFHELAHCLAGRFFECRPLKITLFLFGGCAQFDKDDFFQSAKQEFWISLIGPVASFLLALFSFLICLLFLIFNFPVWSIEIFKWLSSLNIVLGIFNLVPLFPMDGGRILRALIHGISGDCLKATKLVKISSIWVVSPLLILFLFYFYGYISAVWVCFIVSFFILPIGAQEYRMVLSKSVKVEELMQREVEILEKWEICFCLPKLVIVATTNIDEAIKLMDELKTSFLLVKNEDDLIIGKISYDMICNYLRKA